MADYFRETFEGLKQTAEALIDANTAMVDAHTAMVRANEGIKRAVTAALDAKGEHEDLRETVHRLEATVLELVQKLRGPNTNLG